MSPSPKRVREQAVVYLAERDRALLEKLAAQTGLSRTELLRRGLWALAAETLAPAQNSAFEHLIANATDVDVPPDFSERSDEYVYGAPAQVRPRTAAVAEPASTRPARRRKPPGRARPR